MESTPTRIPKSKALALARRRFGGKLKTGAHVENGQACAMEFRSALLGLPWSDKPEGNTPFEAWARRLNDSKRWPSEEARLSGMLPAICVIFPPNYDYNAWRLRVAARTIREILPIAFRAAAKCNPSKAASLEAAALRCETEGTRDAALFARTTAYAAAEAATYAAAEAAAHAYAASAAAHAAAADAAHDVLLLAVRIGVECF